MTDRPAGRPEHESLEQVLADVESVGARAAEVCRAAARVIAERPTDEDAATVYILALESVATQLDAVVARALWARTSEQVRGYFRFLDKPS